MLRKLHAASAAPAEESGLYIIALLIVYLTTDLITDLITDPITRS
jgi:hypothetical protein